MCLKSISIISSFTWTIICVWSLSVCGRWWWEVGHCSLQVWCPTEFSAWTTAVLTVCCSCKWHCCSQSCQYSLVCWRHSHLHCHPASVSWYLSQLVNCTDDITHLLLENGLLLKPSKTEAMVFGTTSRLQSVDTVRGVNVAGTSLQFSDSVKLLCVELDQALFMDRHVYSVAISYNFHIRALLHIRPRPTLDAAKSVAVSIIGARLDYCNSLLYGTFQRNLDHLQRVQNSLTRAVTQAPRRFSATELWRQVHKLTIRQHVNFKLGRLLHSEPTTLVHRLTLCTCELHWHQPQRALCSSTTTTLHQPHASSDFHKHALICSLCTDYLEQYTCFHPWFWLIWHLIGYLQNCF